MVKVGKTLEQARDDILYRIGGKVSDDLKATILRLINDATVYISQRANWRFLRKETDFTITGTENRLPADCDRILCFYIPGQQIFPTEVGPNGFEFARESDIEDTRVYIISKIDVGPDNTAYSYVKFYNTPATGKVLKLWYTRWIEQLTTDDLSSVPPFPPHIWDLIQRKALMDAMRTAAVSATSIRIEETQFMRMLDDYKQAENFDEGTMMEFNVSPDIAWYNRTKGRNR